MATLDTTRTLTGGSFATGRLSSFVNHLFGAAFAWNDARVTRRSLSTLSDAELDDIGLCRGDIDMVSRRHG
ncbi:MAG: DUF1127 domain-containing protein [Rhodobacteraceae bacterium]|nr:DUF1127 domain-containing protein [Paracoccaceae bacterium]